MTYMNWSEDFSVKVREIDDQHKRLIIMLNTLHEALVTERGREVQRKVINDMINYAVVHFGTEEKYMVQFCYPDHVNHKTEHDRFSVKAADLKARVDGNRFVLTLEVLNFLKEWLRNHILVTDRQYSKHFNDRGLH